MAVIAVTPYPYYGDADGALTWLEDVLGFPGPVRWRDASGKVSEADLFAGTAMVSISGGKTPTHLDDALIIVNVDDIDASHERITQATDIQIDQPYGPRTFTIRDPHTHSMLRFTGSITPQGAHR